jgi:hypothetical protein
MDSKPACYVPNCEEKHTERLHNMLVGLNANVNLVAEGDEEEEEENGYVTMATAEEYGENGSG